jgi:putative intracellular protease/amidase
MKRTIGIVLFEDAEELDWAGPWEVLTAGARDGDRVITVAETTDVIPCPKGFARRARPQLRGLPADGKTATTHSGKENRPEAHAAGGFFHFRPVPLPRGRTQPPLSGRSAVRRTVHS